LALVNLMFIRRRRASTLPRLAAFALTATLLLLSPLAMAAAAQDRMPPIPLEKMTEAQRKAAAEFSTARGGNLGGPFIPLLRSPEVLSRARAMGDYLRFKSVLPPRLSEFVILMTAREWTQNYEWDAHYRLALQGGLREEIARAVAEGRRPPAMAEDEETLYEFVTELYKRRSVSDATYARMVSRFGEQAVIDTLGLAGYYSFLAMVLNTARTPLPAGRTPGLAPFPR
jgi:4-carboxymuconolactone decarboxylase